MPPPSKKILDFRPSEIVSGAVLGQNSRNCQHNYWVGQAPPPKILGGTGPPGPPYSYSYAYSVTLPLSRKRHI